MSRVVIVYFIFMFVKGYTIWFTGKGKGGGGVRRGAHEFLASFFPWFKQVDFAYVVGRL